MSLPSLAELGAPHRRTIIVRHALRAGLAGLAAALLAIAGLAGTPTAAAAATAAPPTLAADAFFQLVNNRTGKCVEAPSNADGTLLQQWQCNGGDHQRWATIPADNGFFVLINRRSALCMNVRNVRLVEQRTCDVRSIFQQWQWLVANDRGELVLRSALPGTQCLYLVPNTVNNGAQLDALGCSNTHPANHWHSVF